MYGTSSRRFTLQSRIGPLARLFSLIPFALFISIMLWKTIALNKTLAIPNMTTNWEDILVTVGALLIAGGWTWWLPKRWRPIALMIINIVLTFILYADLVYYRYFQDFITIPVLLQAFQVSALGDSIAALMHPKDLFFIIDWILVIPGSIWLGKMYKREYRSMRTAYGSSTSGLSFGRSSRGSSSTRSALMRISSGILTLLIGALLLIAPIQQATSTWAKGLFVGNWWNASIYNITGLYGFHGYDIYRYVRDNMFRSNALAEQQKQEISSWFDEHKPMLTGPPATFGKYKGSNVLVIQAEAFENFVIGRQINGQEITPNLNKLVKDSLYFNRFFHQTGQGRTSDADFGVQASLHPLPTGSVFIRYPDHQFDALPNILKSQGYTTGAYHAYEAGFWNRYVMYDKLGYDFFMSKKDYTNDEPLGWSLGDNSFFRQSINRMEQEGSPFYSFMITLTSHHPYKLPPEVQMLNVGEHQDTIFGDYLQAIHYVDYAMGELMKMMKANGMWDNTIIAFYGDHDNSITDREPLEQFIGHKLSDFEFMEIQGQVPLIIHLPDEAEKGQIDTVSGQLDLAPTLLHWLGIDPASYYFMGNELQAKGEHVVVQRNGSVTNGDVYYIPSADSIYENGTCYKYATGMPSDLTPCRPLYDEAKKRLALSDLMIQKDAAAQMRKP